MLVKPKTDTKPEGTNHGNGTNFRKNQANAKRIFPHGKTKFEGKFEALKGHVYNCTYNQVDMLAKTTKMVA
jgi:hypothetical protein